jgi:hypothetical protein
MQKCFAVAEATIFYQEQGKRRDPPRRRDCISSNTARILCRWNVSVACTARSARFPAAAAKTIAV